MYDFRTNTHDGNAMSYATLPMFALDIVQADARLTDSAKNVFIRLMAYASAKRTHLFYITATWVAVRTGICSKTAQRALQLLKATGYVNDEGIVMPEPQAEQKAQRAPVLKVGTSVVVSKMETAKQTVKESLTIETSKQESTLDVQDQTLDISNQLNSMLRMLGSTKKVTKPTGQTVQVIQKQQDNLSKTTGQFVQQEGQMFPSHITIPNKQSKIKHSSTPSVTVGLLPSTSSSGFVEPTKPKSLASLLQSFTTGKLKPPTLDGKQTAYIDTALRRMNVTSTSERERYTTEIAYAATQGAFSETYSHTPLKAIRACLNLVETCRWKPNAGMYA
jgi:co-chaperonin GroES (HSP10)